MRHACECGCGGLAAQGRRFIHGHYARTIRKPSMVDIAQLAEHRDVAPAATGSSPVVHPTTTPDAPPPHPQPFDHGRYRIAEEQPGTDLHQPWRLTYCLECREATWTHNHNPKTQDEMLCETCAYMLVTDLAETRVKVQNQTRGKLVNPFES